MPAETYGASADIERVAFVPRGEIADDRWLDRGFHLDPDRDAYNCLRRAIQFAPRPELEEEPSRKQLIPYVLVRAPGGSEFLTMRRRSAQSEQRLHHKISIGAGGHITESIDTDAPDALRSGMRRELHEELSVPDGTDVEYRGLLNDDSSDVGRVHLGLVFTARPPSRDVTVVETEKMAGEWRDLDGLEDDREQLESWSRLLLDPIRRGEV